eukprot:6950701-Prymnesium_polylepis.2
MPEKKPELRIRGSPIAFVLRLDPACATAPEADGSLVGPHGGGDGGTGADGDLRGDGAEGGGGPFGAGDGVRGGGGSRGNGLGGRGRTQGGGEAGSGSEGGGGVEGGGKSAEVVLLAVLVGPLVATAKLLPNSVHSPRLHHQTISPTVLLHMVQNEKVPAPETTGMPTPALHRIRRVTPGKRRKHPVRVIRREIARSKL